MKTALLSLAAVVIGTGMALPASAQDQTAPPPPPPMPMHGHHHRASQLRQATEGLNLTPDQMTAVQNAEADAHAKMKALRADTTLDPQARRKQSKQVERDAAMKVRAVLDDNQKAQFDSQLASLREAQKEQRMDRQGGAPPPAAPAGNETAPPPPSN